MKSAYAQQSYHTLSTQTYDFPPSAALPVVAFNFLTNTVNTLVAVNALTSAPQTILGSFTDCIGWKQWAGLGLFTVGILMELISEGSRKQFKKNPKNSGKIDDTGLWCVSPLQPSI